MSSLFYLTAARRICQLCKRNLKTECQLLESWPMLSKLIFNHQRPYSNSAANDTAEERINYVISHDDFKWVKRLLPPSVVPDPPKHAKYPTPSGWVPPSDTVPDFPYFVPRNRFHNLPVYLLPPKGIVPFTKINQVEGDIYALERDVIDLVRPHCEFEPATRVHEVTMQLFIKGDYTNIIRQFLIDCGF